MTIAGDAGNAAPPRSFLDVDGEPWQFYDELREAGDVIWDDQIDAWVVSSHELIRQLGVAEGDTVEMYPLPGRPMAYPENLTEEIMTETRISHRAIQLLDGEEHDVQHRWWMRAFTPRVMNAWREEIIAPACHAQIDRFAQAGTAELVAEYADRLVPRVFTGLVGIENASDEFIHHLEGLFNPRQHLREVAGAKSSVDPEVVERALVASRELKGMIRELIVSRKDGDGNDIISMVWRDAAALLGENWDETDVIGVVTMVWDAGTHTTVYAINSALYLLLSRPEVRAEVERDPNLLANVVEEALRLYGPSYFTAMRIALQDLDLGGVQVKKGDKIALLLGAGNLDPRRYESPLEADLGRPRPKDHLAFYAGRRSCIGQVLARAEMEESLRVLLERLPDVELDPDAEPPKWTGIVRTRCWAPLNVRFTPA